MPVPPEKGGRSSALIEDIIHYFYTGHTVSIPKMRYRSCSRVFSANSFLTPYDTPSLVISEILIRLFEMTASEESPIRGER